VENYKAAQIPLETFVTDTQYMNSDQDFTTSSSYPLDQFQTFVQMLHNGSQRWVRKVSFPRLLAGFSLAPSRSFWLPAMHGFAASPIDACT
jgi:hypothetical protein